MTRWQTCSQALFLSGFVWGITLAQLALQAKGQVLWKCWRCKVSHLWYVYLVWMSRRTKVTRWQTSSQVFFAVSMVCVVSHPDPSMQDSRTSKVQAWKYWCCKMSDWWEWPMIIFCDKKADLSADVLIGISGAFTLAGVKGWYCVDLMEECILIIWLMWLAISD